MHTQKITVKEAKLFLGSHIEWEHIEMDLKNIYVVSTLDELTPVDLFNLADKYGFHS